MFLLLTFITVWALSPGPVLVMTVQESRKYGTRAGVAISAGAALTSALMVIGGLIVHMTGIFSVLDSGGMMIVERIGAFGIILLGMYAGYKCVFAANRSSHPEGTDANAKVGFFQGMVVMATYIPQALLFYSVIVPQTIEPALVINTIIAIGSLKVALIFGWHSAFAVMTGRAQKLIHNERFGRVFEFASAGLIMGMGLNILF